MTGRPDPDQSVPRATYRVQLNRRFGFTDVAHLAPYLAQLGVSHVYCSPILQAVSGSEHGYDVVDPLRVSEDLGGAPAYAEMVGALRRAELGQILDIVPNHMATDEHNRWWWDVLENGPSSPYACYFDIDWPGPDDRAAFTVLVPILGDHYGRVLESGNLVLSLKEDSFVFEYGEHRLPISPRSLDQLLAAAARRAGSSVLAQLAEEFGALPPARLTDERAVKERHEKKAELAQALRVARQADPAVAAAIDAEIESVNADVDRLDALLQRQNYRLAHWRTASEELDYRRFFNIESLIGLRMEDPSVFAATHQLILELVREGVVSGLRVDHIDGLRDPDRYLQQLTAADPAVYVVVEKILQRDETLPRWPVAGTSGYDFLNRVNNLFVDRTNEAAMTSAYTDFTGVESSFDEIAYQSKQQIMAEELTAEVDRLAALLASICDGHRRHRDHTRRQLRAAVREIVAAFDVYRTYVQPGAPRTQQDRAIVDAAVRKAAARRHDIDAELLSFIGDIALLDYDRGSSVEFGQRLQQFTVAVMAKGVEDTAFYRYNRLVSLNEVGGDPGVFGRSVAEFHRATAASARGWPHSMLTLSTHDTKRSGDVRARINVLSELPAEWSRAVQRWVECNDPHRRVGGLDRDTEYLLYQTLVGAWPIDVERLARFMTKATKEAKRHTSWTNPNADFDDAVDAFVRAIARDPEFVTALEGFLDDYRIVERGCRNSLVQTALLLTCPGVPDLYQGTELWDESLVDPDNRRPVDYECRTRLLEGLRTSSAAPHLDASDTTGAAKLWLVNRVLEHRRESPASYESTTYEPLPCRGPHASDVVAFVRDGLVVVGGCRTARDWGDTVVTLPAGAWRDVLTGVRVDDRTPPVSALVGRFPVAVLVAS